MSPYLLPFLRRFIILLVFSLAVVWAFSEIAYRLTRPDTSRSPQIIELIIPAGTAELVKNGKASPTIPREMIFVLGDTLLVKNQDSVSHQLGPLWIPAGKSASLPLSQANDYAYSCSFQPSKILDITVRPAVTWVSRLGALWYGTPPTLMILLVYSFVLAPLRPTVSQAAAKKVSE